MDSQRQEKLMEENASLKKQLADRVIELELKKRQLEVEAALDNVRLTAGAMRSSSELGDASAVLFQQLRVHQPGRGGGVSAEPGIRERPDGDVPESLPRTPVQHPGRLET